MSHLIEQLVDAMRVLPGVGAKGAQRMVYRLLAKEREAGIRLASLLDHAMREVGECERCRNYSDEALCALCEDPRRATGSLCIVESPADILAIERSGGYQGRYFVLHGHLSPLDRVGPDELQIPRLIDQICDHEHREVILASNSTAEGEATAYFIRRGLAERAPQIRVSRIAHGIPLGGELEYTDDGTIQHALVGRREMS